MSNTPGLAGAFGMLLLALPMVVAMFPPAEHGRHQMREDRVTVGLARLLGWVQKWSWSLRKVTTAVTLAAAVTLPQRWSREVLPPRPVMLLRMRPKLSTSPPQHSARLILL